MIVTAFPEGCSPREEPVFVPAARLSLCLLGPPQVTVEGGTVLEGKANKALALLAYLVVEAHWPHRRTALAALFWPEQPEKQGLQNLRQTLSRLRRALRDTEADPPHLLAETETIQFNSRSDHWLDVEAFRTLLSGTQHHSHRRLEVCLPCLSQLAQADEYYRGEFLSGVHPGGGPALDEWLLLQRERLQQQTCAALQALASSHLAHGKPESARRYARRLLYLDPWNEAGQRLMLRALAMTEGRNAALRHYRAFRRALSEELAVTPEDATLALAEEIRSNVRTGLQPHSPTGILPTPVTPFVGRQAEQRRIASYLAARDQRLITLYGPGGSGKTRLALEIAAQQAPLWQHGVWFIPLAGVPAAEGVEDALATALGLRPEGSTLRPGQLLGSIRARELLLILDSFEHLAASSPFLQEILRTAPEVKILVTSRARLGLPGEWGVALGGLDVPASSSGSVEQAVAHSAVQLFLQTAGREAPGFRLAADDLPHVIRICRLVAGLPLGIQLAASWVRLFPCQQIVDEIERSLDFLHNPHGNLPKRLRSLRATFDYSYSLLSEAERTLFCRLSIFRNGFTTEAARHVAGAQPAGLACLLDKSLLQASPSRRLDVHLTLREYAAEKLAALPEQERETRERHGRFYLAYLQKREAKLHGEHQKEVLAEIWPEMGNVRAAWRWAAAEARIQEIEASMVGLSRFYELRGLYREAEALFGSAAERILALAPEEAEARQAACRLLAQQGHFLLRGAQLAQASQVAEAAVALAHTTGQTLAEATARYVWGEALWRQGSHGAARAQLERAVQLARSMPNATGTAAREVETNSLSTLGAACWVHGDRAEAQAFLKQALEIARNDGNRHDQAKLLTNLGVCALEQGDYAQASAMLRESLSMRRAVGDRRGESITLGNLGNLFLFLGAYDQARTHYEQALGIQREIGNRNDEALSLGNLSLVYHYLGEDATARSLSHQALRIALEIGEPRTEGAMWMKLGHALAGLGLLDGATKAYEKSVTLRREMGWANVAMEPLAGLARVALARGDLVQAQAYTEEILDHLETDTLDGTVAPFEITLTCYRVLAAAQDTRAPQFLASAHELLQERAANIADEEMRRSFLENVRPHREIIQALLQTREAE